MDESTRLESEQVAMPRGFESHRLLQEWLLLVQHTALKTAGLLPKPCRFESCPFLQAW